MKLTSLQTLVFIALLFLTVGLAKGQPVTEITDKVFFSLPVNLGLPATPQRYFVTTDYFNHTLQGNFIDKI